MVARRVSAVVPSTLGDVTRAPLSGRVCLVTGATGGIGRAVVEALAGRDALVVATGRDEGALADLARSDGVDVLGADLEDATGAARLAEEVVDASLAVA